MSESEAPPARGPNGRWQPGRSANPKGRAPGDPYRRATALRAELVEHAPEIVQVVYQAALSGDLRAAQLVLERCLPAIKAVDLPIAALTLPGSTLADRAGAILDAVLGGTLTPDTGGQLLQALAQLVQIRDADQLETRLAALEARAGANHAPD